MIVVPLLLAALAAPGSRIHHDAIVVDGHVDVPMNVLELGLDPGESGAREGCFPATFHRIRPEAQRDAPWCTQFDFERARTGGMDAAFFSIYIAADYVGRAPRDGGGAARRAFDMIAATRAVVARHPDRAVMASTADEVRRAAQDGRFAVLLGIEGGHAIENSLAILRAFHAQGVRYMTLTHTNTNDWADSSGDAGKPGVQRHGGLSDFGREVVREMNALGMLVDVSHVADETFWDVIETTRAPIIASHSSARALTPHPRNLTDEMARAIARSGGVVMVNFNEPFVGSGEAAMPAEARAKQAELEALHGEGDRAEFEFNAWRAQHLPAVPVERLAEHFAHLVEVAGIDHVGLGSDFDGVTLLPLGLESVDRLPRLTEALAARGFDEASLRKLLGGNTLRVLEAAQRAARAD